MTSAGQTVSLCMIVKNERHVLERCLQSVRPFVDRWLIVDTGSTDGTQELIRSVYAEVPGDVVERPWRDFGWNRSEALALALPTADYILTLDADEYLRADTSFLAGPGAAWPPLTADAYSFAVDSGGVLYTRIQLVRAALPWRYEGVLHEYITCDRPHREQRMPGIATMRLLEGARSRDPLTYRRDAAVLEEALRLDPANARHIFYLAQSYRDAREPDLALRHYRQRAAMEGWAEEAWCAMLEAAKLMQQLGEPWPAVQEAYLNAYRYRPWRVEPLYRVGLALREAGQYDDALACLQQAIQVPYPAEDVLFIEAAVYRYLVPREFIVTCFALGLVRQALAVAKAVLVRTDLQPEERAWMDEARQRLSVQPEAAGGQS